MGHASSSAVRNDNVAIPAPHAGAGGDPYGSLAGLGAPKKFKKKPVLVLDPEELAKAHQMFQEASADILGEEAPRPEKQPSMLLGLAPMDDEDAAPDDMGLDDETADDADEDLTIPSAEDVLKMTKGRPGMDPTDAAMAAQALEDGFDEAHRIFPSLPIKSEEEIAAEEAAELAAAPLPDDGNVELSLPAPETPASTASLDATPPAEEPAAVKPEPAPEPEKVERKAVEQDSIAPSSPDPAPTAPAQQNEAAAATKPETEPEPVKPAPQSAMPKPAVKPIVEGASLFERMSALGANSTQLLNNGVLPEPEPESAAVEPMPVAQTSEPVVREPASDTTPEAQPELTSPPHVEPEPIATQASARIPDVPVQEETFLSEERIEEPVEEVEWPALSNAVEAEEAQPVAQNEEQAETSVDEGNYTAIDDDDDSVDGYAFMYANNPRGRITRVAPEGRQNNLRAKLVKDRPVADEAGHGYGSPSVWARIAAWWRGLFS